MKRAISKSLLLLLPALCIGAEQTVPKEGGLCFRFDDNQNIQKWNDMAKVFQPYDCKFSMSIISHWIHSPEFIAMLHRRQQEGHEIMDHTATHAVFTLNARTPEERKEYEANPAFSHWNGSKACFRGTPDESKFSKPLRADFQGNRVTNLPEGSEKLLKQTTLVYLPQTKTAYLNSRHGKELQLRSFWNEDNVNLPEQKNVEFYLLPGHGGFTASDDLLRLQAKASAENFKRAGLRQPVTWIQPGGYEPVLTAENVRQVYARLGYTGAATYPASARKVYNEPNPDRCRFAMMWGDFSLEQKDISKLKHEIANRIARHQVLIARSHMNFRALPGGWTEYLKRHDDLLKWCREKQIPIRTQREWTERLYLGKPDPMYNLMPPLTTDRDGDGIPDGYTPAKTTTLENGAFVTKRDGVIFQLRNLTGMEPGSNRLTYRYSGAPGTEISVKVQPFAKGWTPVYTKGFRQKIETAGPQTCTIQFDIPKDTRFLNLEFRATGVSDPLALDGFSLTANQ